jgi:DHA2 family multidrug resistance protein
MALWGASVTGVQAFGPTVGGWLTEYYNWRWCFLINVPLGLLALAIVAVCMYRTPPQRGRGLDFFGYVMLAGFVGALQMMLDRGEQLDWFSSTEIVVEAVIAGLCLWSVLVHSLTSPRPFLNPRLFRDPNFSGALIFTFMGFVVFTGSMALLSLMMQQMYAYPVFEAGKLMLPRSLAMMVTMLSLGALVSRFDPRLFLVGGLVLQGITFWVMSGFSLTMGSWPLVWTGVLQGIGTALLMVPMNVVMLMTLPTDLRPEGAAFSAMTRAVGQSVGVSVLVFLLSQNTQVAHADLAAHVTPMVDWWHQPFFQQFAFAPARLAAVLDATVTREASMIAYINDFHMLAWVCVLILPLVMLFRVRRQVGAAAGAPAPAVVD